MEAGDVGLLRRAIGLCARAAVAYKAAYMLTLDDNRAERSLLERCTARYALLERLLTLLVECSTPPQQVRDLLDGIDMDPDRYQGRLEQALADGKLADGGLGTLVAAALDEGELSVALENCLSDHLGKSVDAAPKTVVVAPVPVIEAQSLRSAQPTA